MAGSCEDGYSTAGWEGASSDRCWLRQMLVSAVAAATTALADDADMAAAVLLMQYCSTTVVCNTTEATVSAAVRPLALLQYCRGPTLWPIMS